MKPLINILKGINVISVYGNNNIMIKGLSIDSRLVQDNFLFFAVDGNNFDGHEYINSSIKKGCVAVVATKKPKDLHNDICYIIIDNIREAVYRISSNFYENPSKKIKIISVTGTNGKTSIVYFLYNFLKSIGKNVGMFSTIENKIGDKSIKSKLTTPDPIYINEILNDMVNKKFDYCIMEASSHAIDQKRVDGSDVYIAIFSNISHDHLDYHKTFKNYIDSKKMLFDNLNEKSYSIVNSDDKRSKYIIQNTRSKVYTYGLNTISDYKGKIIENNINGLLLDINNKKVNLKIIGDYNASNILAVYSVGKILKLDDNLILRQISSLKTPKGRFDYVEGGNNTVGIVDYAHTPDALKNILSSINNFKNNKKIITVFGAGGDRDKSKRHEMGKIADEFSDFIYLTSDNPRNEDEMEIINDIMDGVNSKNYSIILNRKDAISKACSDFNSDSIILIAGKGHEQFQIIKDKILPHDDMDILKNELNL